MSKYIDAEQLEKDGWTMNRIRQVSSTEMVYETKKPTELFGTMTNFSPLEAKTYWNALRKKSVECAPVRHGQWIDTGSGQECSVCGEVQYGYDSGRRYCPNCGAKMDGGADE